MISGCGSINTCKTIEQESRKTQSIFSKRGSNKGIKAVMDWGYCPKKIDDQMTQLDRIDLFKSEQRKALNISEDYGKLTPSGNKINLG